MISSPFDYAPDIGDNNPLEMVEELCDSKEWKYTRVDNDLLTLTIPGHKGVRYELCLEWQEEFSAVLFSCCIPLEIKDEQYEGACATIQEINENLWMGHFDLSHKGVFPTYRQTLLFRMIPSGIAVDIVQDTIEIAVAECDRFYTTFQLIQAGDTRLRENLSAAIFETVGEA